MPRRQEIPISSLMVEVDLLSAWHLNYLKLPPSRSASRLAGTAGGGLTLFPMAMLRVCSMRY